LPLTISPLREEQQVVAKVFKIGLIGLGWVGVHRHIRAMAQVPGLQLVGVADHHEGRAREVARQHGVAHSTEGQVDRISWLDQVDAIDIATSPMSHASLVLQALQAGKHVITEKPFCMNVQEGQALVDEAQSRGLTLAIVHNFQFSRSAMRLKADLVSGRIGKVLSISAVQWGNPGRRLPSWYEQLPLGLFYDESPHLLYLLRTFAPAPLRLRHVEHFASTHGLQTPALIEAFYECDTPDGVIPVTLSCRFESALSEWYVSVHGEHGVAIVDVFRDIYTFLPNDRNHGTLDVVRTSLLATWQHWWAHLVNGPLHVSGRLLYGNEQVFGAFAKAMQDGQPAPGMSGQDALAVLTMQHDIVAAATRR
jgi:scyllo-inositol 2-dehydrogenase (NADP+)